MLVVATVLAGALTGLPGAQASNPPRPNVVLVVTDDQGIGDFSFAGHGELETPNLDRLAAESPRVARFYVSPVCSPTRASLMTGRYNYRTRVVDTWVGRSMMEPDEVTLAEVLRDAGYATGIFGKWHLGDCFPMRPIDQGFERSLVHRGGGLAQPSEPPQNGRRYTDAILFENGVQVESEGYCTNVFFDAALEFIDASVEQGRPFFAYVATNAPHGPFHDVPPDLYAKYAARDLEPTLRGKSDHVDREARICAMLENVDRNVGRLLAHLDRKGLAEDTIVVFLNDNGPVSGRYTAGLRGSKTGVHDGGIRAVLFVRWPGHLAPSTEVEPIAAHIDLMPTLLEMTGVGLPAGVELDGRSLLPLLEGRAQGWPARRIFLQSHRGNEPTFEHHFAVVGDRWKLVRASGFGKQAPDPTHPFELYDLSTDPGEANDLAPENAERVSAMRREYAAWFEDVSSTRPDNYLPPRIVIGDPAERQTVLTKQDRRSEQGEGWGNDGSWWLSAASKLEVDVTLLFVEPVTVDAARVHVGDDVFEIDVAEAGARISLGTIACPAGDFPLRVVLEADDAEVNVHQVVLRKARD